MQVSRVNWPELGIATVIACLGIAVTYSGWIYGIGTARHMGPGFVPFWLGLAIAVLGIAIAIKTIRQACAEEPFPIRPTIAVSAGIVAWAALARSLGFLPASFVLMTISSMAEARPRPLEVVLTAAILSGAGYLLFVKVLGINLPAINR